MTKEQAFKEWIHAAENHTWGYDDLWNAACDWQKTQVIIELRKVRQMLLNYYQYTQDNTSDRQYDEDGWLADLDSDAHLYLWNCGLLRKEDTCAR
jgi:hypothetical protein